MSRVRAWMASTRLRITIVSVIVVGVALLAGGWVIDSRLRDSAQEDAKGSAAREVGWVESLGASGRLPKTLPGLNAARMFLAGSGSEASQPACKPLTYIPPPDPQAVASSVISNTSMSPVVTGSLTRAAAASANFDDIYQIDPDLSIKKCLDRNHWPCRNAPRAHRAPRSGFPRPPLD